MTSNEDELIETIAQKIHEKEMGTIARFIIESIKPMSFIGGELATFFFAAWLPVLGDQGFNFIDTLEKRENLEKLSKRLKELEIEKTKEKKHKKFLEANDNGILSQINITIITLKSKITEFIRNILGS